MSVDFEINRLEVDYGQLVEQKDFLVDTVAAAGGTREGDAAEGLLNMVESILDAIDGEQSQSDKTTAMMISQN